MSLLSPVPSAESVEQGAGKPAPASASRPALEPTYEGDFILDGVLQLDCGRALASPTLHYAVYGRLDAARDNAVLICHALSGSARVGDWWPEIFAPGGVLNLDQDCVVCVNLLGSCYGSTGPGSVNLETGKPYGPEFPLISIRDNVRAQRALLDSLGIHKLRLVLGGSIGGMQALEWSTLYPDRVARAVIIAVAPLAAMGVALNHLQRNAIQQDPDWLGGRYLPQQQPRRGLAQARQIAMLSYKSAALFDERFGRKPNRNGEDPRGELATAAGYAEPTGGSLIGGRFDISGYLDYQGERFVNRFDANSYLAILRTMETWDPLHGAASPEEAFSGIEARLTFIGISSDWLFPPQSVQAFAELIRAAGADAEYREMRSEHGHDAFLAEQAELVRLLNA